MDRIKDLLLSFKVENGIVYNKSIYECEKFKCIEGWYNIVSQKNVIINKYLMDNNINVIYDFGAVVLRYCTLILEILCEISINSSVDEDLNQQIFHKCLTIYNVITKQLLTMSESDTFISYINNMDDKSYGKALLDFSTVIKLYDISVLKSFWLYNLCSSLLESVNCKLTLYIMCNSEENSHKNIDSNIFNDSLIILYKVVVFFLKFHSMSLINLMNGSIPLKDETCTWYIKIPLNQLVLDILFGNLMLITKVNEKSIVYNINSVVMGPLFNLAIEIDKNFTSNLIETISNKTMVLEVDNLYYIIDVMTSTLLQFQSILVCLIMIYAI